MNDKDTVYAVFQVDGGIIGASLGMEDAAGLCEEEAEGLVKVLSIRTFHGLTAQSGVVLW